MDTLTKTKRKKGPIYTQKVMSKTETGGENGTEVQKIIRGRSKTQAQTQETAVLKIIQEINPSKLSDKLLPELDSATRETEETFY